MMVQFNAVQCYYAEAVYCPPLTTPGNGSVTISSGVNHLSVGSVATYSCDPRYALLGPPTRTCEDPDSDDSVGTWSETMPGCEGEVLEKIIFYRVELLSRLYAC